MFNTKDVNVVKVTMIMSSLLSSFSHRISQPPELHYWHDVTTVSDTGDNMGFYCQVALIQHALYPGNLLKPIGRVVCIRTSQ